MLLTTQTRRRTDCSQNRKQEILVTLDGKERHRPEDMLMIRDAEKPVCVAGVMGGENSEVTDSYQHYRIRIRQLSTLFRFVERAAALGISWESAARFEKGIDPGTLMAAKRAAYLLAEYASGAFLFRDN